MIKDTKFPMQIPLNKDQLNSSFLAAFLIKERAKLMMELNMQVT